MKPAAFPRAFAFCAALAACGCLAPDTAGPGADAKADRVQDANLLAGATSSTNWPQEDAGRKRVLAEVTFDSAFRVHFIDTLGQETKVTGKMVVFASGEIPLFHAPDSEAIEIREASSVEVPIAAIREMGRAQGDSIAFTILLDADSLSCFISGFSYSPDRHAFHGPANSVVGRFTYPLSSPIYALRAVPSDSLPLTPLPGVERKAWCLYIPASPYFFVIDSTDLINLGPLPQGTYPLRLLLIGEPEGEPKNRKLTIFEVKYGFSRKNPAWPTTLELGQKIDELTAKSSISIRL